MRAGALLAAALWLGAAPDDRGADDGSDALQHALVQQIVARAHAYLADQQNVDGSFSIHRGHKALSAPVAVTGLAALSLMAGGNLPDRGLYERKVARAVDWLVQHCREDGYFHTDADTISKMHGQGYALLALTQAVGMYGENERSRARLHAAIERAVGLIERTQGLQGGWWYEPERSASHEGSITVCMIQALRAAKDAGFHVDGAVIDKAVSYMRKSQDPETGRFRYALHDDKTTWALTAAALTTLNALGEGADPVVESGYDALRRADPFTTRPEYEAFQRYGAFYAAQSYWSYRDIRVFEAWWPHFVRASLDDQRPDGSFYDGSYGSVYATAMVSLTLQVPFGSLPVFQR